ncbi:MAG TPA: hypothetical protein PJ998_09095 [Terrimesophilobacter sp.]|nr:hypothetical protein [Terrimesophilobacter sp.]
MSSIFGAMAGTVLMFLLPMVCAIGIGLLWVGLVRKRYGVALMGVAFPAVVAVVGTMLREAAFNSPDAASTLPLGMAPLEAMMPIGLWFGIGVFVIAVLPAGLKVTFGRRKY